ncbi:hypothetical protein A8F94_18870 [Bacillus sp. FJAT-27225]|uniref:anthrax toxin lethal factor-related metalloendopeptidase n=1 Tax=Bacillus sp. FJAT-27225 TaxID=1743144 RepID=UPI00080C22AA|nr:hypothetical protein [Bacillus sp. FJAT-27225]OCA83180.1 hypothetical protein A8F94_18870 [Bacillus sp. FJAT-27225]
MNRKKRPALLIVFALLFSIIVPAQTFAEKGNTQDPQLNQVLERLVTIEIKGESDIKNPYEEALNMSDRIWSIPRNILNVAHKQGVRLKFIDFPITDLPEYAYLKGVVPRGWENTGYTWDDVPGIGGKTVVARIGYSYQRMHSSVNLELHELAHAIDYYVFNNISYSDEFNRLHALEHDSFSTFYYYDYKEEYFAEAFAFYYASEESRATLKDRAPLTYKFIHELQRNIPAENHQTVKN